jgi:hypothetical protein
MHFHWKKLKFLRETHVLNLFGITTISCLFSYKLVTYPWKILKEGYNFVVENICKSYDHTKFRTHLFLNEHGCSLGQLRPISPLGQPCAWGAKA